MKDYAEKYIRTAQLLYDLLPLVICLGDDPYLCEYSEGAQMLALYHQMRNKVHID